MQSAESFRALEGITRRRKQTPSSANPHKSALRRCCGPHPGPLQQGPAAIERGLDALSDGGAAVALLFALAAAIFDLERDAVAGKIKGFRADELRIPTLTFSPSGEPENHLSPYYLARIVSRYA